MSQDDSRDDQPRVALDLKNKDDNTSTTLVTSRLDCCNLFFIILLLKMSQNYVFKSLLLIA